MGNGLDNDIRAELLQLRRLPPWPRVQGDEWDAHSRFIYHIRALDALRQETRRVAAEAGLPVNDFARYVINRWYNLHTHQIALEMLCAYPRVRRQDDPRHPTVDLYLDGIPFDLKLTRFPRAYAHSLEHARAHPQTLARWLYDHQSSEGRYHTANRLFLVLHHADDPARTWEVRRMFGLLAAAIDEFMRATHLFQLDLGGRDGPRQRPWTGLIFCIYKEVR